jgi:hypothetical protein
MRKMTPQKVLIHKLESQLSLAEKRLRLLKRQARVTDAGVKLATKRADRIQQKLA